MSPPAATIALAAALAAAHIGLHGGSSAANGQGAVRYRRWMLRAVAAFVLPTWLLLALAGRLDALWRMPAEFAPLRAMLPAIAPREIASGALAGLALGLVAAAIRARRGARPIGRPGALMPRHRGELAWGAGAAMVAGITEEPFFRLLLPLLVTQATGSAGAGFALSVLIFAALHRYQGWRGMMATGLMGMVLSAVYLIGGMLWLVVLIHVIADLNGLVLWPALRRAR